MDILKSATRITLLAVILAVIMLNVFSIEVSEPLKSVTLMIVSFYFGNKVGKTQDNVNNVEKKNQ